MPTAVVTDSTATITARRSERLGIGVVPVTVVLRGEPLLEGAQATADMVAAAVRAGEVVTTAAPSPEAFLEEYRVRAAAGATEIVSVHLSAHLSGTLNSARLAAEQSPVPVRVVDSRSVGMGLGFPVLAGARRAQAGAGAGAVAERVDQVARGVGLWFFVDDLEVLRRGGRIGAARALMGNALSIKPILTIADGVVAPFERVRTTARAVGRLEELAVEHAVAAPSRVSVAHLDARDRAEGLAGRLRERLPGTEVTVSELSAVIGAHSGPGTLAVVTAPDTRDLDPSVAEE